MPAHATAPASYVQARHANLRPALPNIASRPASVGERREPGHWEGDHIIGKANGSALMWLTGRVTRYSILITMAEGYDFAAALAGLVEGFEQIPAQAAAVVQVGV
jgi:IS30 family transposase